MTKNALASSPFMLFIFLPIVESLWGWTLACRLLLTVEWRNCFSIPVWQELQSSARNIGIQGPLNGRPSNTSIDAASRHRDSLEKDVSIGVHIYLIHPHAETTYVFVIALTSITLQIEQLQMQLQQEKSMRILLERAMGRASSTLSPGHMHFSAQVIYLMLYILTLQLPWTSFLHLRNIK